MTDLLNTWKDQLSSGNKEDLLQKQELLQQTYEVNHTEEEAILLSLHKLGARFSLLEPEKESIPRKRVLFLIALQILLSQLPSMLGYPLGDTTIAYYGLNSLFFILAFLAIAMTKRTSVLRFYLTSLAVLALITNLQLIFGFRLPSQTFTLMLIHLFLLGLLSLATLLPYCSYTERMNHLVGFLGELFILTFLVACATMVVMMLSILLFETLSLRIEDRLATVVATGVLPVLPLLCYHLLTSRKALVSHLPKLLAIIAHVLIIILMMSFLIAMLFGNVAIEEDRNLLLILDLLLGLTLVLILFNIDKTRSGQRSGQITALLIGAITLAIILDIIALTAIGSRFMRFGISPNRIAVLAENILLLANLSMLLITMVRKISHIKLQALFFSLYGCWFLFVVLAFGPIFGYR